ncbi:ATP-binding SpoIIE family protein phosphatase [Nitriliruptor alkaliphilus]|uniref:ATP-binding SpoIIE family protein phosphatase n=1 Tax=Nitriliruptor alkaliphilus TaxID=427918 RepID=UPI0006974B8C|nr:SpoIIE family protein phosphatase [Nitriliruptor alkaliphilus]
MPMLRLPLRSRQVRPSDLESDTQAGTADVTAAPQVDIPPQDPLLAYFQSHPEPIDVDNLKLDSPGVTALRAAGIKLAVPLVSQGELIGLLNLGPRLSEQEYSADDRKLLENLAGQAAPALRVAQLVREQEAEVRRRERYEQELKVAQLIQQNFLPQTVPEPSGWLLNAFYRPAREVGGDFYDFIELPRGELGVVVGDVTDKGVPAALVMASTRSVLRSSAGRLVEPTEVLERVNDVLVPDMPPNMFVTCLYGVLSPDIGRFRFANAGHNLPAVQTDAGALEPRATGMPLGLLPGATYDQAEVTIDPGWAVVLYSDALPEAHDPAGEMYGFPRLLELVGSASADTELIDGLLSSLHGFTGPEWEQEDDITIVTLRRSAGAAVVGVDGVRSAATANPLAAAAPLAAEEHVPDDDPGRVLAESTVRSEVGNERAAIGLLQEALAAAPDLNLRADRMASLETALAEATMNAIEHGNQNIAELLVEIRIWVEPRALVVRVTDQGRGEPIPGDLDEPDLEAKLRGEQSPRGWGLFLIRNLVDDLRICSDENRQILELVMRLDGDAP